MSVDRKRTAISRGALSRPLRLAVEAGLLAPGARVFDYGCGRGQDVERLLEGGYEAAGWDPNHRPDAPRQPAPVVNLGYVVNVIEDVRERRNALLGAWSLAEELLVVGARMAHEARQLVDGGETYADGALTRHDTFQRFYTQDELRGWLQASLPDDVPPPVAAAPGVFFVFRDPACREGYAASRTTRTRALPAPRLSDRLFDTHRESLEPLMLFVVGHGRLPRGTEIARFTDVTEVFGSLKRAMSIVRRVTGAEQWEAARLARRDELLLWLALSRFADLSVSRRAQLRLGDLPEGLQHDVRDQFGTFARAREAGDEWLFSSGDQDRLERAVSESRVGKRLPTALYVHVDALDTLALELRVFEGCARSYLGGIDHANIVKLNRREAKVSYLFYPDFDTQAHPALQWSTRVALAQCDIKLRDFRASANPPILHRKESFLAPEDPRVERFAKLTRQEERAGLLDKTQTIGTRRGWELALEQAGLEVRGHRLCRRRTQDGPSNSSDAV